MNNTLIKLFGFPGTLINGDPMVLDRWRWLKQNLDRLPRGKLIDIGCGSGAFTVGAGRLGFTALGLSWDAENQSKADLRADMLGLQGLVSFEIQDVRFLDERTDYNDRFDVAICCENMEHIMNDSKLMLDMAHTMKSGGTLLLTSPNYNYVPIGIGDDKDKLSLVEDGGHVRIGYTEQMLRQLCASSGFEVKSISFCSGFMSQKVSGWLRILAGVFNYPIAWIWIFPFRVLPLLFDKTIAHVFKWPGYSICLVAIKK